MADLNEPSNENEAFVEIVKSQKGRIMINVDGYLFNKSSEVS